VPASLAVVPASRLHAGIRLVELVDVQSRHFTPSKYDPAGQFVAHPLSPIHGGCMQSLAVHAAHAPFFTYCPGVHFESMHPTATLQ
jgi:hypothetical protein